MKKRLAALALFLHLGGAMAQSPKDPLEYPLKHWGFILLMALLGGLASWYNKVKRGEVAATNLFALTGEFVVSALAGLLAFLICDYFNVPIGITGAMAGLSGHAGARALAVGEVLLQRFVEKRLGIEATKPADLDK